MKIVNANRDESQKAKPFDRVYSHTVQILYGILAGEDTCKAQTNDVFFPQKYKV